MAFGRLRRPPLWNPLWLCSYVAMWLCGYVDLWLCSYVAMWLYGWVAMWLSGYVAQRSPYPSTPELAPDNPESDAKGFPKCGRT